MVLELDRPPLHLRTTQWLGTQVERIAGPIARIDPEALMTMARRKTGLSEFAAHPAFETALERICASAREPGRLHFLGRVGLRDFVVNALSQRLIWREHCERSPRRMRTALFDPMLVIGFPRSGTTLLHRLLCLAPQTNSLPAWKVQKPLVAPGARDRRKTDAQRQLGYLRQVAPAMAQKHALSHDEPEEDFWLLNPSLLSPCFHVMAPLFEYQHWLNEVDMAPGYAQWASMLSSLQAESPDTRLVLKSPTHTGSIDDILEVAPNMRLVQIHRDPKDVLASLNSLMHTLYRVVSAWHDPHRLGRHNLDQLEIIGQRNLDARRRHADRILDLRYDDLVRDPISTVERVHAHLGFPVTDEHRSAMRSYLTRRPQHEHGVHHHDLAECGLRADEVVARLGRFDPTQPREREPDRDRESAVFAQR